MRVLEVKHKATVDKAVNYFKCGFYCSEAILKAFNEDYGLDLNSITLRIATGFGAGLGDPECSCSCITGGVMVLSLVTGRGNIDESEDRCFQAVNSLYSQFQSLFGSTQCHGLTKRAEWGSTAHKEHCIRYVRAAAQITEDLLAEYLDELETTFNQVFMEGGLYSI